MTGRRGGRSTELLDDLMEMRGYWKLKTEALDGFPWRAHFGSGYWLVLIENVK